MRLEINAGGLMGMVTVAELYASINGYVHATENVIDSFADVRDSTYELNGGVGDLADAVDCIEDRIIEENAKYDAEIECGRAINEFLELAKQIDREVAEEVRELEEAFYQANPWARPPEPAWPEDKDLFDWIGDIVSGWIEGAAEVVEKITKFASKAWQSIKDFIDEHKEAIAFVMKVVGYATLIIGMFLIPQLALPFLGKVLLVGLLSFEMHTVIGTADEMKEHGSDFDSYDMNKVYTEVFFDAVEDALTFVISAGIGKLKMFKDGTKLSYKLWNNPELWTFKRAGEYMLHFAGKNVISGIMERAIISPVMETIDVIRGEDFEIWDIFKSVFSPTEILVDIGVGGAEGLAEYVTDVKIKVFLLEEYELEASLVDDFHYNGADVGDNQSVLHSGGPDANSAAVEHAKKAGKCTLEMTEEGMYFDKLELYKHYPKDQADKIWQRLSKKFAQSATGIVELVDRADNLDSIAWSIEIPNLNKDAFPVRISTIDKITLADLGNH